jgi:secreted trypsin-like serine protease
MSKTKSLLTVAMVAVMLAAGAGSAAFAAPQQPGQQDPSGPRIVGGSTVPEGKYSFMAALQDTRKGGNNDAFYRQICGGTLIDSDSVLTAAHCVDDQGTGSIWTSKDVDKLRVVVGRRQLNQEGRGQVSDVTKISIIKLWDASTMKFDVAVLTLKSPVTDIAPVRIPLSTDNGPEASGKLLTVAGWGSTSTGGDTSNNLLEAEVPVVSDAEAANIWGNFSSARLIAAGAKGKGTCYGDSGGPMFKQRITKGPSPGGPAPAPQLRTVHYQYGITSSGGGKGCGGAYPSIYTEVNYPPIRTWIRNAGGLQ